MYERKTPIDFSCPLRLTLSFMGPKWNTCILDELRRGPLRPSQLHRALPAATPRVLNMQLKELEADGLVRKVIYPELPPRSEYYITELGESLLPIIDAMTEWGERHRECFNKK
ncbi:MAG: helix-turn-helix transcriptional regulator [Alistipes sp.]|nr:helix-turn-helix transcriptional regulator [Alistipes sp.]